MTDLPTRMGPDEVRAAIFCGANTAQRLAREWSIPVRLAQSLLDGSRDYPNAMHRRERRP